MLKTPINYLPTTYLLNPTEYVKVFCDYIAEALTNKIKSCYAVTNEFINKKLITILTNEKIAHEFNETKNMEIKALMQHFYEIHQKIKIPLVALNKKLTIQIQQEINEIFNNTISLTIIFYNICVKDDANNSDNSDFFIEKYKKKLINTFKKIYYIFYHYHYVKHFRIKDNKEKKKNATKQYRNYLDTKLTQTIKTSLEYVLLTINNMDADLNNRNLETILVEDLQQKSQIAEEDNNLLLSKKNDNKNCIIC